jgi:hypothetical protein
MRYVMRSPTAADVVRVWELGRERATWYRGLLLLAPSYPDRTFRELAALTIGRRNIALFALRERLFGPELSAVVPCPQCGQRLEFAAQVSQLCPHKPAEDPAAPAVPEFGLAVSGTQLRCRCLTSEDLARAPAESSGIAANPALLQRTVLEARSDGAEIPARSLDEAVLGAIGEAVIENDPACELTIAVDCADCGYTWSAPLDPVSYLWTEIANAAQRLLNDVHLLASAYGWREPDILAMSAARRKFYIEKTGQ